MDQIREMRLFLKVVRLGSLSAAARDAGASAATVWRHLNSLEERLGVQLMRRSTHQTELTEAGAAYLGHAQSIIDQIDETNDRLTDMVSSPKGHIRLQTSVAIGMHVIAPALPRFLAQYPGIDVHHEMMIGKESTLIAGEVDVAIKMGNFVDRSGVIARRLADLPFVLCASPAYLSRQGTPAKPEDLSKHSCLSYFGATGERMWILKKHGRRVEVLPEGRLTSNTPEPMRISAQAGLGISLLPEWWVRSDLASGALLHVLPEWRASISGLDDVMYAVWRKQRYVSSRTRALVDFLVDEFAGFARRKD